MRKQKKKNYIKYKKIFESWNKNRSILRDAKCNYTYIPDEDEEFRQCYVPVTEKNSISFYKVRHALPRYWYIANYAQTECQFRYCGTAIPFLTV